MTEPFITSTLLEEDSSLIDLIDKFISRLPAMRDDIVKAHDDGGWETFSKLIHQLKGVGGNYGYHELSELCANIEAHLSEEKLEEVSNQLTEFKRMAEKILAGNEENHKIAEKFNSR